ncbi:hypothetical protein [Pararobbsia silviterrae]|uniref:hypothetical protein n=1 Tax=Pararobbsia silviterrae TaxID=1792498 RepID=UPI0011C37B9D|nr:hypothetical protein [Pararobbsia silviterrae]
MSQSSTPKADTARLLPWRSGETVVTRSDLSETAESVCAREANYAIRRAMDNARSDDEMRRATEAFARANPNTPALIDMSRSAIVPLHRPGREL